MAENCHNTSGMPGESLTLTLEQIITTKTPEDVADTTNRAALAIVRIVRLALENDIAGTCLTANREDYAADALEVAEALMGVTMDGVEILQRAAGRGYWGKKVAA